MVAKAGTEPGTFGTLKTKINKTFAGIGYIRSREMRQARHVACIREIIKAYTIYIGEPERTSLPGRPRHRWKYGY
jgi:hypothetical protein